MTGLISFAACVRSLAVTHPQRVAITFAPQAGVERVLRWSELDELSTRIARFLLEHGLRAEDMLGIGIRNSVEHFLLTIAAWKIGACALPLNPNLPAIEREQILALARPRLTVAEWESTPSTEIIRLDDMYWAHGFSPVSLPDVIAQPAKAIASGGSTGRPKIIVDPRPGVLEPGLAGGPNARTVGLLPGLTQLVSGPLYHTGPFHWSTFGLLNGQSLILLERFDALRVVEAIQRHGVNFAFMVPTMLNRIARLDRQSEFELDSITTILHSGAPCPPWLKRFWIDRVGPTKICEGYGSTEGVGAVIIRGDDWLRHPGSVGRPDGCELKILDEDGQDVATGEVGEIYMRPIGASGPTYAYIGAPPAKSTADGFITVGDLGSVDADGYVYIADRRVDLIISGGANIYPAEVESALLQHPAVADAVVIGLPDDEWGKTVHAIVQAADPASPPTSEGLDAFARERLLKYKVPKTYEFVTQLPRNEAGKVRRTQLAAERTPATSAPGG